MTTRQPRRRYATVAAGAVVAVVAAVAALIAGGHSAHRPAAFAWLRPAQPPVGWKVARTPGGASFAYPPGWRALAGDPGTASAAENAGGRFIGYLNSTPKSGDETLANWTSFRPDHNREEGDRDVRLLAGASGLSFRTGKGSCVIDSYSAGRFAYREIACLVAGRRSTTVIVAAAPQDLWSRQAPTLERAVSTFAP